MNVDCSPQGALVRLRVESTEVSHRRWASAVLGRSPSLCFPVSGSLVVRATVTHSEATEKYNPSPEVGGKNIDL